MEIKKEYLLLAVLFLIVLGLRLHFTYNIDEFSSDEAYFHLKHIEYFSNNFHLMNYDSLSYAGREVLNLPVFHSVMGLLTRSNYQLLKFIPEFLLSLMIIIVFLLAREISGSNKAALVSAFFSGFIPLFITETLNQISVYSFSLPLMFFLFYCFLKIESKFFLITYIIGLFIFGLTSPLVLLLLLALILYILIMYSERQVISKIKLEVVMLTLFLVFLLQFIFYKKAFFQYGFSMIWQNIPSTIIDNSFKSLTGLNLLIALGIVPLIFGIIGLYYGFFKEKKDIVYLMNALILGVFVLLSFKLLKFSIGMVLLGLSLSIVSSLTVKYIYNYILQTKLNQWFIIFGFIVILAIVFVPSINAFKSVSSVSEEVIDNLQFLASNSDESAVILGNIYEGNLINYFSNRISVLDSNFILARRPVQRIENVRKIYTTYSQAQALELLRKYDVNYILLTDETKNLYGINDLNYLEGWKCVDWVSEGVYEVKC